MGGDRKNSYTCQTLSCLLHSKFIFLSRRSRGTQMSKLCMCFWKHYQSMSIQLEEKHFGQPNSISAARNFRSGGEKKAIIIIIKHILFYYRTNLKTISVLFNSRENQTTFLLYFVFSLIKKMYWKYLKYWPLLLVHSVVNGENHNWAKRYE